jgi:uncharacterized membrane protein
MLKFNKIILLSIISITFIIIGCSDPYDKKFSASGDNPYWSLNISPEKDVTFSMKGMENEIKFNIGEDKYMDFLHTHTENGILFEYNILDRECHNYEREDTETYMVIVRLDGEKFVGCGQFRE